jgi:hypothetical protein
VCRCRGDPGFRRRAYVAVGTALFAGGISAGGMRELGCFSRGKDEGYDIGVIDMRASMPLRGCKQSQNGVSPMNCVFDRTGQRHYRRRISGLGSRQLLPRAGPVFQSVGGIR